MILLANRASTLLYRFLKTFPDGVYILPANVCPVVPLTFLKANVPFEFFDINQETLCLDENEVINTIREQPRHYSGILFVRTYGYMYDTSRFFSNLKSLDVRFRIIDDKCLCYPDFLSIAPSVDMELYSTGYTKTVDIGYGGFAKLNIGSELKSVNDPYNPLSFNFLEKDYKNCLNKMVLLGNHDNDWLDTTEPSFTIDEYTKNVSDSINSVITHKQVINAIYKENLPPSLPMKNEFQHWRYNILTENKDTILKSIFHSGLYASSHYIPSSILFNNNHFPVADKLSGLVINLFNDYHFSVDQAIKICKVISNNL
jgi:hypothetical protein